VKSLVFLLEEPSARDLLEGLLPRLLPTDLHVQYLVFEGKQDLEKNIIRKMKHWLVPNSFFVILRDQDAADCRTVKAKLANLVAQTGRQRTMVRVVCRELESWVVGDWRAVASAFDRPSLVAQELKEAHRHPDQLVRPIEALRALLPEYQKRDGARRVGELLVPARNRSASFQAFCSGLARLLEQQ